MGGELVWTPVRTNSDDEQEESWEKLNTAPEGEDSNNCWYYRPSGFHQLKGLAMRAGTQYLESVQHQIDERKSTGNVEGSPQFLSEVGIIAAAVSPTDERAFDDASTVIRKAVSLLRSWLREPVLGESGHPELPMMNLLRLGLPLGAGFVPVGGGTPMMDDMMNMNFRFSEVSKVECCPAALHRFIYPHEARVLAAMLTRVLQFLPDTLDWKEFAGGLRDLLQKCGEDEMTMIQG